MNRVPFTTQIEAVPDRVIATSAFDLVLDQLWNEVRRGTQSR